jgi:hypothetical protein
MDRPSRGGNSEYDLWRVDQEGFNGVTKVSFSATILVFAEFSELVLLY